MRLTFAFAAMIAIALPGSPIAAQVCTLALHAVCKPAVALSKGGGVSIAMLIKERANGSLIVANVLGGAVEAHGIG